MDQVSFDLAGDEPAPHDATLSVGELTSMVRDAVREAFPREVWVRGEVQNLNRSRPGHCYFTLVEKAGRGDRVLARLDVALFRDDRRSVERALADVPGAELGNDVEVRIRGRIAVYPALGRLQLVMTGIDPVFTVGGIAANRERVLRALAADGLLETNARLPLALVPLHVGVVTSIGSAAYHDFVHELESSPYAWRLDEVDVRVQGAAAARRVKWALRELARREPDVIVLVRGGGSRADLAPFDTDLVARAIAESAVPVITGIGHEIDRSVADEVAYASCKTPTACAQLLVDRVREFVSRLDDASQRVRAQGRRRAALASREIDEATRQLARCVPVVLVRARASTGRIHGRIEELARRRARDALHQLDASGRRVSELGRRATRETRAVLHAQEERIVARAEQQIERAALRLDARESTVRALDPRRVLERGYSITRDESGHVVRRASSTSVGRELVTELASGRVTSRVESVAEDRDD